MTYAMEPLTSKGVDKLIGVALKGDKIADSEVIEDLKNQIAAHKVNSPRIILFALEKVLVGVSPEQAVMGGESAIDTLRICQSVVKGDWETIKGSMTSADVNDARLVRMALAQYLKTVMLNSDGQRGSQASDGIEMLAEVSRTEEGMQLPYTVAILHKVTKRFQK